MGDVRRAGPGDRDRMVRTVVDAFAAEPTLRWVWPAVDRYRACADDFFSLLVDLRMATGEVWVIDDGAAVAMWDPPGGLYLPPEQGLWDRARAGFTEVEKARWDEFDEQMRIPDGAGPYWFLGVLATAPPRQGQGLGRAVVAPMLGAADRAGLPAYLETAEVNQGFYRGLGFQPVREAALSDGGPRCYLMRRDPETKGA